MISKPSVNKLGDATLDQLLELTRLSASTASIARSAALLLRYLLERIGPRESYAGCSIRCLAEELHSTKSKVRTALNYLLSWGWLDRSQHVANGLGHYCLTHAFAATAGKAENEELYRAILDRLPERFNRDEAAVDKQTDVANAELRQGLQAVSQSQLMQRIFELNRIQRQYHYRGYNKGTLRNLCTILHWFLREEAQRPGEPIIVSMRALAKQTGLVFRTAKRSRDQLAAWGVLVHEGDVYRLNHGRLVAMLYGEDAGLLLPPPLSVPSRHVTAKVVA